MVVLDTARVDEVFSTTPTVMPTVSKLGSTGTTYQNAYAAAPWTLPSHGSIFTGTYPSKHGAHGNNTYLGDENRTLPEAFFESGYETLAVSNNTWITEEFGFGRGFDSFWKGWQYYQSDTDLGAVAHELGTSATIRAAVENLFDGNPFINLANLCYSQFVQSRTDSGAARTTDRIDSWLRNRGSAPFFLFVNYIEPHIRYQPPKEHAERFLPNGADYEEAVAVRQNPCAYNVGEYELSDRETQLLHALYRGELSYVDEAVGRLKRVLQAEGEWEDTIMVVLGDHGENIGDHGFLGHQYNIYDTLLHVPLIVTGGSFDTGSATSDQLVQLPDLVPTLLDETGIEATALREQNQACSFHPSNSGRRKYAMSEYHSPQPPVETLAARFGSLPKYAQAYNRTLRAIRTDEYKLIVGSDGLEELYDVADDPDELIDRSEVESEQVANLAQTLGEWLDSFEHTEAKTESSISGATKARLADLGYM
jgi:arylsulfatase A-like enzyme